MDTIPGREQRKKQRAENRNAGARAQEAVDLVLRYPQSQAFLAAEELVNEAKRRWIQQVRRRQASILRFFGTVRVWERAKQCFVRSKKQVKPLEPPPKMSCWGLEQA